jgi:hypothetical protein
MIMDDRIITENVETQNTSINERLKYLEDIILYRRPEKTSSLKTPKEKYSNKLKPASDLD